MYEITAEITAPGCPPFGNNAPIFASAINDHGVVVGHYFDCAFNEQPFMWSEETGFVAIPLPEGVLTAEPMDVNNNGEVVGSLARPGIGFIAFHWKNGLWTELSPLPGLPQSRAFAINQNGLIVGESFNNVVGPQLACMWHERIVSAIEFRGEVDSVATDVNEQSSIVGQTSTGLDGSQRAFLWNDGNVVEIPPLPGGTTSGATALNNHGFVVGRSVIPVKSGPAERHSWVFHKDTQVDLGLIGDNSRLTALEINDSRQIVGYSSNSNEGNQIPFLWQHQELIDLRTLVVDLPFDAFPARAFAINQHGKIVVEEPNIVRLFVLEPLNRPLGDANIDCVVDELDLIAVLDDWGPRGGKENHPADMVTTATFQPPGDGKVDGADLAVVLGNWNVSSSDLESRRK